jgi:sugar lactone lactonase YvrE
MPRIARAFLVIVFFSIGAAGDCPVHGAVTTLAGSGSSTHADGTGAAASFHKPYGVSFSPDASLIAVADTDNNRIRLVVVATGVVTTLAGSGSGAFADGTGAAASFKSPNGVSFSPDASLIAVADQQNNRIRLVVVATGVVTTLAGSGSAAFADGTGAAASFDYPSGVSFSPDASLIAVADQQNNRIRLVVFATGVVTTLAGSGSYAFADGTGAAASFKYPAGVSFSPDASLIAVADTNNIRIRLVVVATGVVTTLAGSGSAAFADGTGAAASFFYPYGVAFSPDASLIAVADKNNNRIRLVVFATGVVTTLAGSGSAAFADGTGASASFGYPTGVSFSPYASLIAVADYYNNRIRLIGVVSTNSTTCVSGKFLSTSTMSCGCVDCPVGYFSANPGHNTECFSCASVDCDSGTWVEECTSLGLATRPECIGGCSPGTHIVLDHTMDSTNKTQTLKCSADAASHACSSEFYWSELTDDGTCAVVKHIRCASCGAGFYQRESNKNECESCPTGRYANLQSARECTTCPAGRYTSTIGSTSCDACRSGQFGDSSRPHESCHECESCPKGKYANLQGARECATCTVGHYTSTINSTSCDACISGQFGNSSRPQGSADHCQLCTAGKVQKESGKFFCNDALRSAYIRNNKEEECPGGSSEDEVRCENGILEYKPGYWHDGLSLQHPISIDTGSGSQTQYQFAEDKKLDKLSKFYRCPVSNIIFPPRVVYK